MTNATNAPRAILVVDTNPGTRASLTQHLASCGCDVLQAPDARTALDMMRTKKIGLVLSELYLGTGESDCLIQAMRQERMRGTRTIAYTTHATPTDREWAKRWGASAFVIQPSTPERIQYIVTRLLAKPKARPSARRTGIERRDSLNMALAEIERGEAHDTLSIIFGRPWWDELQESERSEYRKRAKKARVTLRSDAMMSRQFVEVRSGARPAPRTLPRQSPYSE